MRADRQEDRLVLFLDAAEILARAFRRTFERANALSGNDQAPEKIKELDEPAILCRERNGLMEGKVLFDGAFAAGNGADEDADS